MCGGFIGDILGTVTGGLIGNSHKQESAPQIIMQEETLNPEKLDLTQDNTAQTTLDDVRERNRRRGLNSTVQTSGMGTGVGTTNRTNLLGG